MKKTKKIIIILLMTLFLINFNPILSGDSDSDKNTNMQKDKLDHPIDTTGSYSFTGRWEGKLNDDTKIEGDLSGSISHFSGLIGLANLNIQLQYFDNVFREIDCSIIYRIRVKYPFDIFHSTWFFAWGIYWRELIDPSTDDSEFIYGRISGLPVDDKYDYGTFVKAESFKNLHLKFSFDE